MELSTTKILCYERDYSLKRTPARKDFHCKPEESSKFRSSDACEADAVSNGHKFICLHETGLEITRIASQFAIQIMSVAMQLKFCIAVGCEAKLLKTQTVINKYADFLSVYSSHLKFSTVFFITEYTHSVTVSLFHSVKCTQ
jgi:hypothetical protein